MAKYHKPRAGSKGYSPRRRAKKQTPSIGNYPARAKTGKAAPLGFICFKAGMTHIIAKDLKKNSPTFNMDIRIPVTVLDCPPLTVFGIRAYSQGYLGPEALTQVFSDKLDKDLARVMQLPKEGKGAGKEDKAKKIEESIAQITKLTLLVHTQPRKSGMRKKKPEVIEIGIGGDVKAQWEYAKGMLGKEINAKDVFEDMEMTDVCGITKGKGFQGPVKKWGVKIQKRKAERSGHHRHVGAIGLRGLAVLGWQSPKAGRMGFNNRVDFNKAVLKIGDKGEEVTPKGGFINYGLLKGAYILMKGSVAGPEKRAVALRKAMRTKEKASPIAFEYISTASQQGA